MAMIPFDHPKSPDSLEANCGLPPINDERPKRRTGTGAPLPDSSQPRGTAATGEIMMAVKKPAARKKAARNSRACGGRGSAVVHPL